MPVEHNVNFDIRLNIFIPIYSYKLDSRSIYKYIQTNIKPLTLLPSNELIENTNKQRNVIPHRLIVN